MIIALIVTGHRSNPFDLEGSFTVHFDAKDFSPNASPHIATSRGFTLTVKMQGSKVPVIEYVLLRESDGVRFDGRIECRPSVRNHIAATGQFIAPGKSAPVGKLHSALHWDGANGIFSATWIVPRPAANAGPGHAQIVALPYESAVHSGGELAHGVVSDREHGDDSFDR